MMWSPKKFFPRALVFAAGLWATAAAFAGPPYATDDPEPVDPGEHELFISFERTRTGDGSSGSLPMVELNYGAAQDLHLSVGVPWSFDDPHRDTGHRGLGDIELSAKYRVLQETDSQPMLSFYPAVTTPTGDSDKGLGAGKVQWFLPVWLQKNWGDWQVNTGGGYTIDHSAAARNHWFFGWQVQRKIDERWTLGGELFHSTEETRGEGSSSGFNLGAVFEIDPHDHLLFSAGRGLSNVQRTNQLSSYIGYQLTW